MCHLFFFFFEKCLKTLFGEVSLFRTYYYCSKPSDSRFPRDEELGLLPDQELSPCLLETLLHSSVTTGSFQQAVKTIAKFTGVEIEYKQAQRECLKLGYELEQQAIKAAHRVFEEGILPKEDPNNAPDAVVVSLDGVTVEHCAGGAMEIKLGRVYRAHRQAPTKNKRKRKRKKKQRKRSTSRIENKKRAKEISRLKDSREEREYQAATGLVKK